MIDLVILERATPAGPRGREAGQGQGQEGDPPPRDQVRRQALDPSQAEGSQQHEDSTEDAPHPEEPGQVQLIPPRTESGKSRSFFLHFLLFSQLTRLVFSPVRW